jgi:hypothetical protein
MTTEMTFHNACWEKEAAMIGAVPSSPHTPWKQAGKNACSNGALYCSDKMVIELYCRAIDGGSNVPLMVK